MKKQLNHNMNDLAVMQKAEVIYARMAADRKLYINSDVTKESASILCAYMMYLNTKSEDPIELFIHSNGGDVDGFFAIYDTMKTINSPVHTYCLGKAYSAGAFLLCSGESGFRFASQNSDIMIHGIQCGFPISPEEDESMNYMDFLNRKNVEIMKIVSEKTGRPLKKVISDCSRDLFLTAEEALEYGIIDGIIGK